MSGLISLLDHTLYSAAPQPPRRAWPISREQLELLHEVQRHLSSEVLLDLGEEGAQLPLRLFKALDRDTILTQCYVGALSFGETRVSIGSRFDGTQQYFLRYLLERCWNISSVLLAGGLAGTGELCGWLLVCRLAMQLQEAWRKGVFRAYRSLSCYDSQVRGQLDIPRHIRLSGGQDDGRAAYRTREYSPDNPCNRLLLLAFAAARRQYPRLTRRLLQTLPQCGDALRSLQRQIPRWQDSRPRALLEQTRQKITHPLHRGYEPARLTARAILRHMGPELQGDGTVTGVLRDLDKLWEELLAKTLFSALPDPGRQQTVPILGGAREIRPDFLLPGLAVVDAKYRLSWGRTLDQDPWEGGVREDVFQVLSYMLALNCPNGAVVFPVSRPAPVSVHPVSSARSDLLFWRLPFWIPREADSYQQFQDLLQAQTRALRLFAPGPP